MVALLAAAAPLPDIDGFEAHVFRSASGAIPYRLFRPTGEDASRRYPLVLFLHGIEALGSDNSRQISGLDHAGSHLWTSPAAQPCFVVAPQCPAGHFWVNPFTRGPSGSLRRVMALVEELQRQLPIDADRIYVAGQSMGAFGVWALIENWPDRFAAAVPVCGGGRVSMAGRMTAVPIWAFHGAADPIVPAHESRRMIAALERAGGNPRYTEYPLVMHKAWNRAWAEPGLTEWVFAQSRAARTAAKQEVPSVP
jgi:predicted peptidase